MGCEWGQLKTPHGVSRSSRGGVGHGAREWERAGARAEGSEPGTRRDDGRSNVGSCCNGWTDGLFLAEEGPMRRELRWLAERRVSQR